MAPNMSLSCTHTHVLVRLIDFPLHLQAIALQTPNDLKSYVVHREGTAIKNYCYKKNIRRWLPNLLNNYRAVLFCYPYQSTNLSAVLLWYSYPCWIISIYKSLGPLGQYFMWFLRWPVAINLIQGLHGKLNSSCHGHKMVTFLKRIGVQTCYNLEDHVPDVQDTTK